MKRSLLFLITLTFALSSCSKLDFSLLPGTYVIQSMKINGVSSTFSVGSEVTYYPCSSTCKGTQSIDGKVFYNFVYTTNSDNTITISSLFEEHFITVIELSATKLVASQKAPNGDVFEAVQVRK